MTDRAPGHEKAVEDLQCYNCGMKGHMVFACPEDTRRVPAGLEASRKRQASGNGHHAPMKRSKGPIVTRYPHPSSSLPPRPITYSPRPRQGGYRSDQPSDQPASALYHKSSHPSYLEQHPSLNGKQGVSQGFPLVASQDEYGNHFQRSQGASLETPPKRPLSGQYDQYRSGPLTSPQYRRPYSVRPDQYNEYSIHRHEGPFYPNILNASPPTSYEQYYPNTSARNHPPAPPQPNTYGNAYGYDGNFPVQPYPSNHRSPPPGSYTHQSRQRQHQPSGTSSYLTHRDDRSTDRSSYRPQRAGRQYSEHRFDEGRQSGGRRDRRTHHDSKRRRSRSEHQFQDRPTRRASPGDTTHPASRKSDSTVLEGSKVQKDHNNDPLVKNGCADKYVEDFGWEEEMIFKELPAKVTKDLIREPLPTEWTGDPIMPPKYDKETIISKYVTATNVDDFALSIRETKAWQTMQHHPTFLPPTEIRLEKLGDYERAMNPSLNYTKNRRHQCGKHTIEHHKKNWGPRAKEGNRNQNSRRRDTYYPSRDDRSNNAPSRATKRNWNEVAHSDAEELSTGSEVSGKRLKICSPEPGEVSETDGQAPTSTTEDYHSWKQESSRDRLNSRGSITEDSKDHRSGRRDTITNSPPRQSLSQTPSTPTQKPGHLSSPISFASSKHSSLDTLSGEYSKQSTGSSPSRPSSEHSSMYSPLTPIERELLGMDPYSDDGDTGRESSVSRPNGTSRKPRKRVVQAAYQRRW